MITTVRLKMWGNSLGIRFPSVVARSMQLEDNMEADLTIENGQILIAPHVKSVVSHRQRRPFSFYQAKAKKLGVAHLIEPVEITPDAPRGLEIL